MSTAATAVFPASSAIPISAPSQLVVAGLQTRQRVGRERAYHLSGSYVSACDLSSALGRLFSAVAQGQVKPKTASTLAYLGQTLVQALPLAQHEYINAFGTNTWRETIRESHEQSADHTSPEPESPTPEPGVSPDPAPTPADASDEPPASE